MRSSRMAKQDENGAGYGKPPLHSRFKKGEAATPTGDQRQFRASEFDLLQELQVPHQVHEDGDVTTVTKQRALVMSLTAAALKNDMRAANMLLALMRHYGIGNDEPANKKMPTSKISMLCKLTSIFSASGSPESNLRRQTINLGRTSKHRSTNSITFERSDHSR